MNLTTRLPVLACLVLWGNCGAVHAASSGMIGHSGKDPRYDCSVCHSGNVGEPQITVAGPVIVDIDSTVTYTLSLHGARRSMGGVNIAASEGVLGVAGDDMRLIDGELTHRALRTADDTGTVSFKFQWRAPDSPGTHTLFIAGVLGNGDRSPARDGVLQTNVRVKVIDRGALANDRPRALTDGGNFVKGKLPPPAARGQGGDKQPRAASR